MESMLRSDDMRCLFCDAKLPLHRKIANGQFCSTAHRKEYWKEQERLAVERLTQTDQTLRATFAELHASLAEQEPVPVAALAELESPFPGSNTSRKKAAARKISPAHEELARRSSNRGRVGRANFVNPGRPDGSSWSAFVPRSEPLDFLISDFVAPSVQAMSLRFEPAALLGVNTCGVSLAGPVKLSSVPSVEESAVVKPAATTATPKAVEPSASPVSHDLIFRFAPEEPAVLRTSPDAPCPAPEILSAPVAPTPVAEEAPAMQEAHAVEERPATQEAAAPEFAARVAMKVAPVDGALSGSARIEVLPVEARPLELAVVAGVPARAEAAPRLGQPAAMKTLAAYASLPFGSSAIRVAVASAGWMPPAMLPFHELAPFGQAESLCTPPLARLLGLPRPHAAAVACEPSSRVRALDQAGSLMLGARAPRPIAPSLRYASAARYPLSAPASEPLRDTVQDVEPHSFDVAMPELRLRAIPSIESPDWGWLVPLSFEGQPVAGYVGPCVPAAGLVSAFPDARDPNLPASRLEPVPDPGFQAPPSSLRMFAHWALPSDPTGRNPLHYAADFLSHAPRDLKLALFVIPVLLAMALHPRLPKLHMAAPTASASTERGNNFRQVLAKQLDTMQQNVAARAAVALTDDFRSGLEDWQMRSDLSAAWSFDSNGFVRPGSLALYRPSMGLTDYQLRFLGLIDKNALSFVSRAEDFQNYYVIKLVIMKPGPLPTIGVTRYAVIDGKAQERSDVVAPINAMPDMLYRVDLDVHNDTYLLSLQGQIVDTWSEPRLTHGGIGFFTARGEESRIRWVQLTHQYDMLGRLCAYLAPVNISNTNGRW